MIKRATSFYIITILFFYFLVSLCFAQQTRKCSTHERYLDWKNDNLSNLRKRADAVDAINFFLDQNKTLVNAKTQSVITIPVVVHVLYYNATQNISDAQILSQLDVLNKDYRKLNLDIGNTPLAFQPLAADCEIQFCLAQRDPNGNATNGITRKAVTIQNIGNTNNYFNPQVGEAAWDANNYLNIWVCAIDGFTLGFANYPGTVPLNEDGVVIDYRYFGTTGTVLPPFNKGRTATHEVGHWLNLEHIWGDDFNNCQGTDNIADTPNQAGENYGCPMFPITDACSPNLPGVMFMNYMDYTDDSCMYMFTLGQKQMMRATLNGLRSGISSSLGCSVINEVKHDFLSNHVFIYPNPSNGEIQLSIESTVLPENIYITICDMLGGTIIKNKQLKSTNSTIDLKDFPNGVYFVSISSEKSTISKKIIIQH